LSASVFGEAGVTGSSVGITLDDQGRAYVTNTNRDDGEIDIRKNKTWLLDSLALTSPRSPGSDQKAGCRRHVAGLPAKFKEQIIRVTDTDGDGVGDKETRRGATRASANSATASRAVCCGTMARSTSPSRIQPLQADGQRQRRHF